MWNLKSARVVVDIAKALEESQKDLIKALAKVASQEERLAVATASLDSSINRLADMTSTLQSVLRLKSVTPKGWMTLTRLLSTSPPVLTGCLGQFITLRCMVTPQTDISNATLVASSMLGPSVIPSEDVNIRIVKKWFQASGATWSVRKQAGPPELVPELLLKNDSLVTVDMDQKKNYVKALVGGVAQNVDVSIPNTLVPQLYTQISEFDIKDTDMLQPVQFAEGETREFVITIRLPTNAAGNYRGVLTLLDDEGLVDFIPLALSVLDVSLEKPIVSVGMYYHGQLRSTGGSISSKYKTEEQLLAELRDMKDHGVEHPTSYQDPTDSSLFTRSLELRAEAGFQGDLYSLGIQTIDVLKPDAPTKYVMAAQAAFQLAAPHGITQLYIYGVDEAEEPVLSLQRAIWKALQDHGFKVFVAAWRPGHWDKVKDSLDLLVDGQPPSLLASAGFHAYGHKIYSYNTPQVGIESPSLYRRNYGLRLWQADYDGSMPYAYQAGFGFIWNDFDHETFREHNFTYPTSSGVIGTLAWEAFRDGVDDMRYVATVLLYIELRKDVPQYRQACIAATAYLGSLRTYEGDLDNMRVSLIDHLNALL